MMTQCEDRVYSEVRHDPGSVMVEPAFSSPPLSPDPSIPSLFLRQADRLSQRPFLWSKRGQESKHGQAWHALSWGEVRSLVLSLAAGLLALGLKEGDRVVLVSENRPEWAIADLAILAAGGIAVPAYITNTAADHLVILDNVEARFVVVSTTLLLGKVAEAARNARVTPTLIAMEPVPAQEGLCVIPWKDVIATGAPHQEQIRERVSLIQRTSIACIIHTSGTGGAPKGVTLTHGALLADGEGAFVLMDGFILHDQEKFLSFLPLSHAYEHLVGFLFPVLVGAEIAMVESVDSLASAMKETRPTLMTAVPRLYEVLQSRILKEASRATGLHAKMFAKTLALGRKRHLGQALGPMERLLDRLLTKLVRSRVQERFGGRLKAMISGGAPLNPEVETFFSALGVQLCQGYGLTETAPAISCTVPWTAKPGSVGRPIHGIEVWLAPDGEILVKGETVMQGYWNDPVATAQVLQDGVLATGDIGVIDAEGHLYITDRKRDIIVTSGGDTLSPQRIEGILTLCPEIAQAMVYGDARPWLAALLVPDAAWAEGWAKSQGQEATLTSLATSVAFQKAMAQCLERVNEGLSVVEKIRRFIVVAEPFSLDNSMLTPTLKIRRQVIRHVYGAALEALYRS